MTYLNTHHETKGRGVDEDTDSMREIRKKGW
jgi:hypothetical protein